MNAIRPPRDGSTDSRIVMAAANNAAWCAAMCRSHGITTSTDTQRWWSARRTPLHYPDAVTLDPVTDAITLLSGVDTSAGCSVKDSFATLDLAASGFRLFFGATWIHCPATGSAGLPPGWQGVVVRDPAGLSGWLRDWGERAAEIFVPALLEDPDVRLVSVAEGVEISAVAVLNRAAGAVGISNLVCAPERAIEAWQAVVAVAATEFPGLDLVGYEQGGDLDPALAAGLRPIGPLRVWGR